MCVLQLSGREQADKVYWLYAPRSPFCKHERGLESPPHQVCSSRLAFVNWSLRTIILAMASMRQAMLLQPRRLARGSAWRALSSSTGRFAANGKGNAEGPPAPPKGVDSSTSALDYKLQHPRPRPPSLPEIDPPKWSAEYAVTNIL